jgi:hypothetical protein
MKLPLILVTLIIVIINSSFQCNKCVDISDSLIDNTRQWLPLKGKTQLTFLNSNGASKTFRLLLVDTIQVKTSCTGNTFKDESIGGKLSLDSLDKDFIYFAIHPPNNLCIRCITDRSNEVSGCNILSKPIANGTATVGSPKNSTF